jgi:hypothetical protein
VRECSILLIAKVLLLKLFVPESDLADFQRTKSSTHGILERPRGL